MTPRKPLAVAVARPKPKPHGAKPKPHGANKLETAFGDYLEVLYRRGECWWYAYERVTLKLADDCRYTPDWCAVMENGQRTFYECKGGFRRDDAIVKLRVAASTFWFDNFVLVTRVKGAWQFDEIKPG